MALRVSRAGLSAHLTGTALALALLAWVLPGSPALPSADADVAVTAKRAVDHRAGADADGKRREPGGDPRRGPPGGGDVGPAAAVTTAGTGRTRRRRGLGQVRVREPARRSREWCSRRNALLGRRVVQDADGAGAAERAVDRRGGTWRRPRRTGATTGWASRRTRSSSIPIQGDGIRIYGAPGGSAAFISVGELGWSRGRGHLGKHHLGGDDGRLGDRAGAVDHRAGADADGKRREPGGDPRRGPPGGGDVGCRGGSTTAGTGRTRRRTTGSGTRFGSPRRSRGVVFQEGMHFWGRRVVLR